ncbi:serine/threonine protein kinase VPS15, putative [Plasmodium yoelii]|uniref:Serine/threonine protein kinase VPS15, putative n=1 Tax=Plasmodium yoelii TaxID=5861 RepID=A0A4V0KHN8_PLAYE|nr:serine/threonine protein kinase VPS15, putative [Plasmodium yoelii]VTZ76337.1 serine/threonine protein kinase VPS15, putative [Plasmodium yoelii]|eukprot:XP_022811770.2 serine/threonine protein kinase VPS15, putative [Plasmodium yoelii]
MGNTLYSNIGQNTTEPDEIYCKYLNNLYNIYNYLLKYEHFYFMNSYTLNSFCHVLEGINNNEGHVLIKICKLKGETQKIKRILYTLKFLFSFDLFPNVLPYNRMSVYENNIYIYRKFIFKSLDNYLLNEQNNYSFCYFYIFQALLSIIQLHSLGIYHGHIKSENFLIQNNMHILITDIDILNKYIYYIPKIRYDNERKEKINRMQEDIFNLGILILEVLLKNKNISYLFHDENYDDNNDNFYSEKRKQTKLYMMESKKIKKYPNFDNNIINISKKKNSENFFHALSLPFINKKIINEEEDYFQKNKNLRMNIDKYKYYNYHYINHINYINIYNDIYNNGTFYEFVNTGRENLTSQNVIKNKAIINENNNTKKKKNRNKNSTYNNDDVDISSDTGLDDKIIHAYSDYELFNDYKETKKNKHSSNNLNLYTQSDIYANTAYTLIGNYKDVGNIRNKEKDKYVKSEIKEPINNRRLSYFNMNKNEGNNESQNSCKNNILSNNKIQNDVYNKTTSCVLSSSESSDSNVRRKEKSAPYKIWKIVSLVKNPFVIYSLINHFFLEKNKNIFQIFNYWSYHIFPSTYKYVFFPLCVLKFHPIFRKSEFFILLIHFNLPFILFNFDIFSKKEKDKYALIKRASNIYKKKKNEKKKNYGYFNTDCQTSHNNRVLKTSFGKYQKKKKKNINTIAYYINVVKKHTTNINKYQMQTYINDANLNSEVKAQILEQWKVYKKQKKMERKNGRRNSKKLYHCKSYFPFPILSYSNTHDFYKFFLQFYKNVYFSIFYGKKSYMDIFKFFEIYKRYIYLSLFRDFYFKNAKISNPPLGQINNPPLDQIINPPLGQIINQDIKKKYSTKIYNTSNEDNYKWNYSEDIYQLINILICSYNFILYDSIKMLILEIIYLIICHIKNEKLERELIPFLFYCFKKTNDENIKVIIIKCIYIIINNGNKCDYFYMYIDKFLPKFFMLKNTMQNYQKYVHAKYLPLFSTLTIQYIYNSCLLKQMGKISLKNREKKEISKNNMQDTTSLDDSFYFTNNQTSDTCSSIDIYDTMSDDNNNILTESAYMAILKDIRNKFISTLNETNDLILFEFYQNIIIFCTIMNKKWVKVYILPYMLKNSYKIKNIFIKAICIKTIIIIVFYINEKGPFEILSEYINSIILDKNNDLILKILLYEFLFILKKNYKKWSICTTSKTQYNMIIMKSQKHQNMKKKKKKKKKYCSTFIFQKNQFHSPFKSYIL